MKKLPIIAAAVAALALQSAAHAGLHLNGAPIFVSKSASGGTASGALSGARYYTGTSGEFIGCGSASDLVSSIYVSCSARDANGNLLTCFSTTADGQARQAVSSVNSSSFISFSANTQGRCTNISVNNTSYLLP